MREIRMKNILKLWKFNMYVCRKTILGWTVAITALMTLYMILFPSIQDIAKVKMEAMPTELLQLVGMEQISDMSNYTTYYGMIYGLILVAVSIFAATFSAGLITKEEKSKSIEFLSTLSVSRTEIYIAKYFTSLIAVGLVLTFAILATIACGAINGGESFSLVDIMASAKMSSFTPLFFGGVALSLASISAKLGTGAIASSVVLVSYMIGYLGELLGDKGEVLKYFSPFIQLSVEKVLEMQGELFLVSGGYGFFCLVVVVAGGVMYRKRDFRL